MRYNYSFLPNNNKKAEKKCIENGNNVVDFCAIQSEKYVHTSKSLELFDTFDGSFSLFCLIGGRWSKLSKYLCCVWSEKFRTKIFLENKWENNMWTMRKS